MTEKKVQLITFAATIYYKSFVQFQDGEKIDHTWLDYVTRSNNKVLKIKASKLDDTGIFVCRGVNGFGKASVNIQLIVVGKSSYQY